MNCPSLEGPAAVIILVVLGSPLFYVRLVEHSFFAQEPETSDHRRWFAKAIREEILRDDP